MPCTGRLKIHYHSGRANHAEHQKHSYCIHSVIFADAEAPTVAFLDLTELMDGEEAETFWLCLERLVICPEDFDSVWKCWC